MFDEFKKTADDIHTDAFLEERLVGSCSDEQLRELSLQEKGVKETAYGSIAMESEPKSRAAMHTKNNIDAAFGEEERKLLADAKKHLAGKELVSIETIIGDGSEGITGRLIVPKEYAHLVYAGKKLFKPTVEPNPTHQVIMFFDENYEANKRKKLADKDITIRLAHSPKGGMIKIIRNCNYFGEWKKGIFAAENWRVKQNGNAIFLHAGCREDYLKQTSGDYKKKASLFVALSANGKTSLTCKVIAKESKEDSWLVQDDGGALLRNGSFKGFEAGALYVKTENLNPEDQVETYYAALKERSVLENVFVDENRRLDFDNLSITSNGRAIVERRDFMHASRIINSESIDNLFIITRGSTIPAVAKLTPEQAAAFMVIGQSMESSAGDPSRAGTLKNEFFCDPFVAGNKADHANLFYDILKSNPHINCYLLNTSGIGEGYSYKNIALQDTVGILRSIFKGGLDGEDQWVLNEKIGLHVPKAIRDDSAVLVHPEKRYSPEEFEERQKALNTARVKEIEKYSGLDEKIREVFLY